MSINANVPFMDPTDGSSTSKSIQILKKKERVLDHVLYEMYMFLWSTKRLKELLENEPDGKNCLKYNANYIAQKCSLRNILEFFSSTHPRGHKTSDIYFGKIYKIAKVDEKIIDDKNIPLEGYRLFSDDFFNRYLDEVYGRKYYGTDTTIKNIVNKTVSHLTDQRFDWGSENFEQIINEKEVNNKIIQDVKIAIQAFLDHIQLDDSTQNLYYVYYDNDDRKSKNLSDELNDEDIKTLLVDINSLIKY